MEWGAGLNTPPNESETDSPEGLETAEKEVNATASKVNTPNPSPPNLKSPLFKQYMSLRALAMLADDRFVKDSNGASVFAIQ